MTKKILFSMLALFAIATTAGAQGNSINGHEYVDLGLPSGLLWATCNVGATKPEEYGDYFAWGETEKKDKYSWDTYRWCKGSEKTLTKYCNNSEYGDEGFTDNLTTLLPEDDAAAVNWKGGWRMPTYADFQELLDNTTNECTELNGVKGWKFTASNGHSIFLPSAGAKKDATLSYKEALFYWSSSLRSDIAYIAVQLYEVSKRLWNSGSSANRYWGLNVRPVWSPNIAINETNFPDEDFRNWLLERSYGEDGILTVEEIAKVKKIIISGGHRNIAKLDGIEFFTALESLGCSDQKILTSLNLSGCTTLKGLACMRNKKMTSLDVSGCTALETLDCDDSQLEKLDLSKNTELTTLWCEENQLTELDVSQNKKLTELVCYGNKIKGAAMQALVESLPEVSDGKFVVIDAREGNNEGNVCTKSQVAIATGKGWRVCYYDGKNHQDYAGSDDTTAIDASLNDNGKMTNENYYSVDGVKLQGEPTKKGVYIIKGKKVKKEFP